jgi:hypothetical protein
MEALGGERSSPAGDVWFVALLESVSPWLAVGSRLVIPSPPRVGLAKGSRHPGLLSVAHVGAHEGGDKETLPGFINRAHHLDNVKT